MITADDLLNIRSTEDAATLFCNLGYPVQRESIDSVAYCGVDVPLEFGCRFGNIDLFFASAVDDAALVESFGVLSRRNVLRTIALVNVVPGKNFSLASASAGRIRKIVVDRRTVAPQLLDRINSLATHGRSKIDPAELFARALDRESLTRDFFRRFRGARHSFAEEITRSSPGESDDECARQALLVLSRLLFLYFLQQRGWLNGDHRFLIDRFHAAVRRGEEFYPTVLLPLFFGCLNTAAADRDESVSELGSIPYLNGGLFHPSPFELRNVTTPLRNEIIGDALENSFEPFSFISDEADREAFGIDPEMLGKVFENLMEEEERCESGSFYTPKNVVDEIVNYALAEACAEGDHGLVLRLRELLSGEPSLLSDQERQRVGIKLHTLTLLDPACGSGAFLLSALYAAERLWRAVDPSPPPQLRRRLIESSLFGVDVKADAVRLCELRLWLAIVTEVGVTGGEFLPLPNLDRNIFQGNSLFAPIDFLVDDRRDLYRDWVHALRGRSQMITTYRTAPPQLKRMLGDALRKNDSELATKFVRRAIDLYESEAVESRSQTSFVDDARTTHDRTASIDDARRLLTAIDHGELDFFAYDIQFAHVLAGGGFDLVVGNPPWVRHSRLDLKTRRKLRDRYRLFRGEGGGLRQADLSVAFCEKALSLVRDGGTVGFLLPSKIATAGYAATLRRELHDKTKLAVIVDWSSRARDLFDADTFPMALVVRKTTLGGESVLVRSEDGDYELPQQFLSAHPKAPWIIVPIGIARLIDRVVKTVPTLRESLHREALMGVKTGDNDLFFLDEIEVVADGVVVLPAAVKVPREAICRTFRGRDIGAERLTGGAWMLWSPARRWRNTAWLRELADFHGVAAEALELSFVRPEHYGIKVAWKDVARSLTPIVVPATVSIGAWEFPMIPNQTSYFVDAVSLTEATLIAPLLRSIIPNAVAYATAQRAKDGHYRYFGSLVSSLPFPQVDTSRPDCRALLEGARKKNLGASREVERSIARLYGVADDELELLRSYVEKRRNA